MALSTPLTKLFKVKHPVMLAGMGGISGPTLAAAVTNAGGIGCVGGGVLSPKGLEKWLDHLIEELDDKNAPFGVDLLIPQVGGSARKTNYDITKGNLDKLGDIMIKKGCKLFVCAVGAPPKAFVDKMHSAGIVCMNMVGSVKHVQKALDVGVDMICAQGGEGGGHTGDVATSVLLPAVVDACKGRISPLTGEPVIVVAGGGICDGRGLASIMSMGASGAWVGTRFVACTEADSPPYHKKLLLEAGHHDTVRTLIYSGRPARVLRTPFVNDWETNRQDEMKKALAKGIIPVPYLNERSGVDPLPKDADPKEWFARRGWPLGQVSGSIKSEKNAKQIVEEMVKGAVENLSKANDQIIKPTNQSSSYARL